MQATATLVVAGLLTLGWVGLARGADAPLAPPGGITSVVGTGRYGFAGDGGPATAAQIAQPRAVVFDGQGDAFIADTLNQRIRKVDASGTITTVAGTGVAGFSGDGGPATEAQVYEPHGVAIDSAGNLYISDSVNNRIRRVDHAGVITTVAGNGSGQFAGDGGPAAAAVLNDPKTMSMDSADHLYFVDTGNNRVRRIDLATMIITTVAGKGGSGGFSGDGGPAIQAALNAPKGVWITPTGNLYIGDTLNHRVRRVDPSGIITTVAGTGVAGFSGDGGPATQAQLNEARAVAVDSAGNVYIGEEAGDRVRRVDPSGVITTIVGTGVGGSSGNGGPATAARLDRLRGLMLDGAGHLYIADAFNNQIREVTLPNPPPTTTTAPPPTTTTTATQLHRAAARSGYWMLDEDGTVYPFGAAQSLGSPSADLAGTAAKAVDLEPTPSGNGYWVVDNRGRVSGYGDAPDLGSADPATLAGGEEVTSISATRTGNGYWLFTTKGRVLPFGDARFLGDMHQVALNGPVLDSITTASGNGYYMVASDGGIFAFGDAIFYGSMGNRKLNGPVQSLVPDGDGAGYWLVASDGGIFSFDAPFRGSMGGVRLNRRITGMVRFGSGYLMVGEDGGIFDFSDHQFDGSLGDHPPARPITSVAALDGS